MTLTSFLRRLFLINWRPKGGDASIGGGEAKVKGGGAVDGGASSPVSNKNARKKHAAKKQRQRQRKSSSSSLSSSSSRNASSSSSSKADASSLSSSSSSSSSWNVLWFAVWLIYTQFIHRYIYSSIEVDKDCCIVLWIAFAVLYPGALSVVVYLMKSFYSSALSADSKIAPSNRKALREHRRKASRELRKCNGRKAPRQYLFNGHRYFPYWLQRWRRRHCHKSTPTSSAIRPPVSVTFLRSTNLFIIIIIICCNYIPCVQAVKSASSFSSSGGKVAAAVAASAAISALGGTRRAKRQRRKKLSASSVLSPSCAVSGRGEKNRYNEVKKNFHDDDFVLELKRNARRKTNDENQDTQSPLKRKRVAVAPEKTRSLRSKVKSLLLDIGFENETIHAINVSLEYDGDVRLLKYVIQGLNVGVGELMEYHSNNDFSPNRDKAVEYQETVGNELEQNNIIPNMGDLATEDSEAMAMAHYAPMEESGFQQQDPNQTIHNRMNDRNPCLHFLSTTVPNMIIYHSTGVYCERPQRCSKLVLFDRFCFLMEKGDEKFLKEQCVAVLKKIGVYDYFVSKNVKPFAAASVLFIPTFLFNLTQILFNTKKPVRFLVVGRSSASVFREDNKGSNRSLRGCGTILHPQAILDKERAYPPKLVEESDASLVELFGPLLEKELNRLGKQLEDVVCQICWKMKFKGLSEHEIKILLDSIPSYFLKRMKEMVEQAMPSYPKGTKKSTIAEDLRSEGAVKFSFWANIYIECCKPGERLHEVKEMVEQAKPSYPKGTNKSTIAKNLTDVSEEDRECYIECCKPGEGLHEVKEMVEQAKPSYPKGTNKSTIAKNLTDVSEEDRESYLKCCELGDVKEIVERLVNNGKFINKADASSSNMVVDELMKEGRTKENAVIVAKHYADLCSKELTMKRAESQLRNTFQRHQEELKKIADIETNWVKIDEKDDAGEFIKVLMVRKSAGSLYDYVRNNFFHKKVKELQDSMFWDEIKDYNWQFCDKAIEMHPEKHCFGTGNAKRARVNLSTIALPT